LLGGSRCDSSDELLARGAAVRQSQVQLATALQETTAPPSGKYHRDNPFAARVLTVSSVPGASPALRQIVVDLEGSRIRYRPGDWLGVFPQNEPATVRLVLKLLGARGQDEVETPRGCGPLWRALLEELDLARVSPRLVEALAGAARDRHELRALTALAASGFEAGVSLVALLRRFPSARPAPQALVSCLSPLIPTVLPIASSNAAMPNEVEALLLLDGPEVGADGRGVASRFVSERLRAGEWLPVFIDPDGMSLPADDHEPILMVADDLGVGPFKAFLADRATRRARGRSWLWVQGTAFAQELGRFKDAGALTRLDRLPSRDSSSVPATLMHQADVIWRWLVDRTPVHVCGSERLVRDVETALGNIAESYGGLGETSGPSFVARLRDERRLFIEVVPR
jgi:sulfite reductase (NADPH) flavoprotein alpha-component